MAFGFLSSREAYLSQQNLHGGAHGGSPPGNISALPFSIANKALIGGPGG